MKRTDLGVATSMSTSSPPIHRGFGTARAVGGKQERAVMTTSPLGDGGGAALDFVVCFCGCSAAWPRKGFCDGLDPGRAAAEIRNLSRCADRDG